MAERINWSVIAAVVGGAKVAASGQVSVEGYDVISFDLPGGASGSAETATVQVQPADAAATELMLITSTLYDEDITYDVGGGGGASGVALNGPQLFVGNGVASLLGGAAPLVLTFSSEAGVGNDAAVTILVGRDAAS